MGDAHSKRAVRPAHQAGRFYDGDAKSLRATVESYLAESDEKVQGEIVALLSPHAGYLYSGRVAGAAFGRVRGVHFDRVMLMGPSHYHGFHGAALPSQEAFSTPLGEIAVDGDAVKRLAQSDLARIDDEPHIPEHCLEVELPFMQVAIAGGFSVVPILLGDLSRKDFDTLADALQQLIDGWKQQGLRTLIVASSDTYHGYDPDACRQNDRELGRLVEAGQVDALIEASQHQKVMACGWRALALMMLLAQRNGLAHRQVLQRSDSHEAAASAGGYVVGYVAAEFTGG